MTGKQLFDTVRRHSIDAHPDDHPPFREWDNLDHHEQVGWHQAAAEIFEPAVVGLARHTDDTGLQWEQVVVATAHGDATFHVFASDVEGERIAEATADHLVALFDVLGIKAVRGEVDHA